MAGKMKYKFKHTVVGGTFDRLHQGHKHLLGEGFARGAKVTIGISSDKFAKERSKADIQKYEDRLKALQDFLALENFLERATFLNLNDVFGSTLDDDSIDSIIVTKNTLEGANQINTERKRRGLKLLKLIRSPLIAGEKKKVISSTNIRQGLTNRQGDDYFSKIVRHKHLLPDDLRAKISKPHGKVILEKDLKFFDFAKYPKVILVGDIVTKTFVKLNLQFDLAIVDLKTNRRRLFKSLRDLGIQNPSKLIVVRNKRGTITKAMTKAIRKVFVKNFRGAVIKVIGEEDLAVIPVVIQAPIGSIIFYGQRGQGIVCVDVEEVTKEKFLKILGDFKKL